MHTAKGAKYHRNCLVNLYNHVRTIKEMSRKSSNDEQAVEGLAFAQLVVFIEEAVTDGDIVPLVFKLADLAQLYVSRMEQLLRVKYDRSAQQNTLVVPRYRLTTYGRRAFSVAGPTAWNSRPVAFRDQTISDACF